MQAILAVFGFAILLALVGSALGLAALGADVGFSDALSRSLAEMCIPAEGFPYVFLTPLLFAALRFLTNLGRERCA